MMEMNTLGTLRRTLVAGAFLVLPMAGQGQVADGGEVGANLAVEPVPEMSWTPF